MVNIKLQRRRQRALERLEKQLESGVKTLKNGKKDVLTTHDKKRIKSEMEILFLRTNGRGRVSY